MEEVQIKKSIVFILGIALGLFIGIFGVLMWQESSNNVTRNNIVEPEIVSEESKKEPEVTSIGTTEVHEKIAEDLRGIVSNSYYRTQWLEFQKHGKQINERAFKVFYVACDGQAYVRGRDEFGGYNGQVYYLIDEKDADLYDDQIITVPKRKVVKRYGTIDYRVRPMTYKKVPRIMIMDVN